MEGVRAPCDRTVAAKQIGQMVKRIAQVTPALMHFTSYDSHGWEHPRSNARVLFCCNTQFVFGVVCAPLALNLWLRGECEGGNESALRRCGVHATSGLVRRRRRSVHERRLRRRWSRRKCIERHQEAQKCMKRFSDCPIVTQNVRKRNERSWISCEVYWTIGA